MKYIIATLGCKVNQYESEAMEQLLQSHGHTPCAEGESADAVIVNPQHYAVVLKYDIKKAQAPYVVAKGVDEMALYIRSMAAAHALEVLEIPPLARAIYFSTQINQQIPSPLYAAVAHVLTYILHLKAYRSGLRGKPQLPDNLPIPERMANKA